MPRATPAVMMVMSVAVVLLLAAHLFIGPVRIAFADVVRALAGAGDADGTAAIVRGLRLPRAITAAVAGAALAVCGLIMQTFFRNPLAGPSVIGISSGAALGVAMISLVPGLAVWTWWSASAQMLAALLGSLAVLGLIVLADRRIGDGITLLIVGLMVGHACAAVVSVLQAMATGEAVKGFVLWGMGSFAGVTLQQLPWLVVPCLVGLALALVLVKPLNALLLGEDQATALGVDARSLRLLLLTLTGLLAAAVTAFCGPIAFIGMAVPHLARALLRTSDHRLLMPAAVLCGALVALACDLIARSAAGAPLPLNAVTSLLGVPVVVWVLLQGRQWARAA